MKLKKYYQKIIKLLNDDYLELMKDIPNGSVEYLNENNSKLIKLRENSNESNSGN